MTSGGSAEWLVAARLVIGPGQTGGAPPPPASRPWRLTHFPSRLYLWSALESVLALVTSWMLSKLVEVFVTVVELLAADVGGEQLVNLKDEKELSPFSSSSWLCPCEGIRDESDGESILDSDSQKGSDLNQSDGSRSVHSSDEVGNCPCSR